MNHETIQSVSSIMRESYLNYVLLVLMIVLMLKYVVSTWKYARDKIPCLFVLN